MSLYTKIIFEIDIVKELDKNQKEVLMKDEKNL